MRSPRWTTWTLLLNDDVAPLDDHWLDRMLAAADDATVAVGCAARPRATWPARWRRGRRPRPACRDRSVARRTAGRTVHLGRGSVPAPSGDVRTVPAATAACLFVRTATHRTVGGFHGGFDYGSEDVDLCLRLAAHGEVRVAMGAVLLHEEGATRLLAARGGDRHARARRQAANRALLDARHAPDLRRQVVRAAFAADASRAGTARVAIGVAGPAPDLLVEALALRPACRVAPRGSGALTVVTDPTKLADAGSGGDVPLVGWVDRSRPVRAWDADVLERLDALFVLDAANDEALGATFTAEHPTLPVIRVGDAVQLGEALRDLLLAPRWTIRIGTPAGRAAARWGDGPVAEALRRELRAHGLVVRSVGRDGWGRGADRAADVTLHLKGRGVAPVADAQTNVVWVMSHPSEVAPGELEAADLVIAGSDLLAERYRGRGLRDRSRSLPQAADARRFSGRPVQTGSAPRAACCSSGTPDPSPVRLCSARSTPACRSPSSGAAGSATSTRAASARERPLRRAGRLVPLSRRRPQRPLGGHGALGARLEPGVRRARLRLPASSPTRSRAWTSCSTPRS
jgi:hypothetical protein